MNFNQWQKGNYMMERMKFMLNRLYNEKTIRSTNTMETGIIVELLDYLSVSHEVTYYHESGLDYDVVRLVENEN